MPTYEYRCESCGHFEAVQPITADALKACPTCGQPVKRLISRNVNIVFKGSGFHITDYRSDSYKSRASSEPHSPSSVASSPSPAASSPSPAASSPSPVASSPSTGSSPTSKSA